MVSRAGAAHAHPEVLGGMPVFVGARVPVRSLCDYLEGEETLAEFPHQFPSVKRERTIVVLCPMAGIAQLRRPLYDGAQNHERA
ncbi:MAG: DUF433 domain-containing protein [Gammaproteobacteria bacterium]|nr:DUF433 domain-containing protein [Gammaproteobacteria bacterium]